MSDQIRIWSAELAQETGNLVVGRAAAAMASGPRTSNTATAKFQPRNPDDMCTQSCLPTGPE